MSNDLPRDPNPAQAAFPPNVVAAVERYNLGVACQRKGQYTDALLYYREALQLPEFAEAWNALGLTLAAEGDRGAAILGRRSVVQTWLNLSGPGRWGRSG